MASRPEGTRAASNLALIKQLEAQKIPAKVEQSGVAQLALPMERALAEVVYDIIIPDKAWNRGNARYRIVQVSHTHLRAHETSRTLVCRLLL